MHVDIGDNKIHTNFSSILSNKELQRLHHRTDEAPTPAKRAAAYLDKPLDASNNNNNNSISRSDSQIRTPRGPHNSSHQESGSVGYQEGRRRSQRSSKHHHHRHHSSSQQQPIGDSDMSRAASSTGRQPAALSLHANSGGGMRDENPNVYFSNLNSNNNNGGVVSDGVRNKNSNNNSNNQDSVPNNNNNNHYRPPPPPRDSAGGGEAEDSSGGRQPRDGGDDDEAQKRKNSVKPGPKLAQTKIQLGMRLKRWMIISRIGAGSFGETFTAMEMEGPPVSSEEGLTVTPEALELLENLPLPEDRTEVCIKVEQENKNVLRLEALALKKVQSCPQVVRYLGSGCTNGMNFLVMEKLGPNLAELRRRSLHGTFNIYTTLMAGISCFEAIRGVHEQGLVHRDIKPSNFVTGLPGTTEQARCFIIDFGLARRYRRSSGEIRAPRDNAGFRGTSRYASVSSHLHLELGRVDDLWSLLFMLVEFATGTLPWRKYKDKDDIGRCKEESIGPHLVRNLPREFQPFLAHLQTLRYEDEPDYDLLLALMHRAVERRGYPEGKPVDWELDPSMIEAAEAEEEEARALAAGGGGAPGGPSPAAALLPRPEGVPSPAAMVESSLPPRRALPHVSVQPDSVSPMRQGADYRPNSPSVSASALALQGGASEEPDLGQRRNSTLRVSEVEVSYQHSTNNRSHAKLLPPSNMNTPAMPPGSGVPRSRQGSGSAQLQAPEESGSTTDVAVEDDGNDFTPMEGPGGRESHRSSAAATPALPQCAPLPDEEAAAKSLDAMEQQALEAPSAPETPKKKKKKKSKTKCKCDVM